LNSPTNPTFVPLAIVGIGCLFPKADGPGAYWANIKHGVDCIGEVPPTHWNPTDYYDADPKSPDHTYARRGGFLTPIDFNPLEFGIAPRDLEATDTSQLLGLVAAKQALTDAGVEFDTPGGTLRSKTSVILGVTGTLELVIPLGARLGHPQWRSALKDAGVADDIAQDVVERIGESYVPWQENSFPGLLGNVVAGRIANRLDLHGTNCVVDAACASSLSAVHLAAMELATGKADVVVTGGADTFNDIFMFMCFSKTPALSKSGESRPFDSNGDGTALGEGLGMVVLKRLADAEVAGDTIYAVLKGIGTSSDGKGNAIYAPSAEGQKRCLNDAYERAGVNPATVELIEAHGTGTKVGDAAEASALTDIFRKSGHALGQPWCALGSVKSQIGHTKAAAGAASLIKVALALHNKVLPPTIKVNQPVDPLNSPDSPFYVNGQMRPWLPRTEHPRRAGLSAFGFGGSNFHAVLEEYQSKKAEPDWDGQVEILAVSGRNAEILLTALSPLGDAPQWTDFARAAETSRVTFDASENVRLVLVAHRTKTDLAQLLTRTRARLSTQNASPKWHTPEGAFFGSGPAAGKLAVLFPGQGSQSVGMLRELACTFPEMLESLADAGGRLSDFIYPPTSFAADAKAKQDDELKATDVAQPALGAVSYGAYRLLSERFGLRADGFGGHSYGELPALAAGGRISEADFYRLSRRRGELMAAQRVGDPGAMLAVIAPLDKIEPLLIPGVVIANKNSPQQTVLSGRTADIEQIAKIFTANNIRAVKLPVAAAFHSELVSDASRPFREELDRVEFRAGSPVYANTTAAEYPPDPFACRDLLGHQLAKPVEFVGQIHAMLRDGAKTFFEVGPGGTLTKLVQAIIEVAAPTDDLEALALESPKKAGTFDLATALAKLAARGHRVDLAAWEAKSRCRPAALPTKPIMTVPIGGANIVNARPKRPARAPAPSANGSTHSAIAAGTRPMNDPKLNELSGALQITQQTLAALQKLQEQTAQLHKQFLESQESAQRTLHQLVAQQQSLFFGTAGPAPLPALSVREVATPAPVIIVPPVPQYVPPKAAVIPPKPALTGVSDVLLAVVAEKTGYPVDMLNLGMSLDGDLGVDSIKRVEILSALQDKLPNAPVVKPEHLGTLHTLQDVADFLAVESAPVTPQLKPRGMPNMPGATLEMKIDPTFFAAPATLLGPVTFDKLFPVGIAADIAGTLLAVVAEKTGYPVDMLNLGMSLDGDLGVDSIKRVEILSALQDRLPSAPVVKPEHLGTLHTLQDVADFLGRDSSSSELTPKTEPISAIRMPEMPSSLHTPPPAIGAPSTNETLVVPPRTLDASISANRSASSIAALERIDRSILQAVDIDLTAPRPRLPVPEGSVIWIVSGDDSLGRELAAQLQSLRMVPTLFRWADPIGSTIEGQPVGLVLIPPRVATPASNPNRTAFLWIRIAAPKLRAAGRAGFLGSVVQLDGSFGLMDLTVDADAALGGLAGMVKTARHEWPEVACKAIDIAPDFARNHASAAAVAIADELFSVGPVEVGISESHRCTVELARTVRKPSMQPLTLGPKDVIVVTGGARGVTAEVAAALAETFKPTLILTGRTALPTGPEPAWMAGATDEAGLKKVIAEQLGGSATPKAVSESYQKIVAQREIRMNLARMERAGSKVAYLVADVANSRQVADLLHQVQVRHGTISGLIHGAGVLADKRIEDLTDDQFDAVYSTKVAGLRNLLDHLGGQELKLLVLFSSTTARFGRTGQVAYAVANEVLNKMAQVESRRRPNTRVVAINWGPWDGGMVTPGLRKVFESEGVGTIPLDEGGIFAVQELNLSGRTAEVVALGKSRSVKPGTSAGGSIVNHGSTTLVPGAAPLTNPPIGDLSVVFERAIELASHPVLRSHVIDGRAVLPMALHMEWLAHAALHGNPGLVFHGFNEMRVTNGIMVEESLPATVRAFAGRGIKSEKNFLVPVELRGRRRDGREVVHSKAEVILTAALPKAPATIRVPDVQPYPHPLEEIYRFFLFHGPDLHGIERIEGVAEGAFVGSVYPAPAPGEWLTEPLRNSWVADPLALDASFQMMILWSYAQHGAGSLPCFAGRYRQYRRAFSAGPVRVQIRITRDNGSFARADIDYLDAADGTVIAQIQDYECVIDPQLNQAFRRNQLSPRAKA